MLHECTEKYPEHVCPDEDEPGVELNTRNVAVLEGYLSYVHLLSDGEGPLSCSHIVMKKKRKTGKIAGGWEEKGGLHFGVWRKLPASGKTKNSNTVNMCLRPFSFPRYKLTTFLGFPP